MYYPGIRLYGSPPPTGQLQTYLGIYNIKLNVLERNQKDHNKWIKQQSTGKKHSWEDLVIFFEPAIYLSYLS